MTDTGETIRWAPPADPPLPSGNRESPELRSAPAVPRRSRTTKVIVGVLALVVVAGVALGAFAVGRGTDDSGVTGREQLLIALELHRSGQLGAAAERYRAVLADDPDNAYALYNLGLIAQTRGRFTEALDRYDEALAADPSMTSAAFNRALTLRDLGRTAEAIAALRSIVDADPRSVGALFNLGTLLVQTGSTTEGNALLERAYGLDPSLRPGP